MPGLREPLCGGWVPGDRMAEDGVIPEKYPITVLPKGWVPAEDAVS